MSYTIYKRPDSPDLWVRWTIDGRRVRKSLGTSEPEVAEILAADLHRAALLGELDKNANSCTLDQALGRYVMEHARHLPSLKTVIYQAMALRRLIGKPTPLSAIDDAVVTSFIARRRGEPARRGASPKKGRRSVAMERLVSSSTVNKEVSLLRSVMNRARTKWKLTVGAVDWKAHRLQEADAPTRWLTPDEVEQLLAAAAPHLRPLIVTALATGLRSSNVHHLDWSQIDLTTRLITVRVKSRKPGGKLLTLPIAEPLFLVLANLQPKASGPVFLYDRRARRPSPPYAPAWGGVGACPERSEGSRADGGVMSGRTGAHDPSVRADADTSPAMTPGRRMKSIASGRMSDRRPIKTDARKAFLAALKRAGITRKFTWHDLRHTAASWLVQRGVPLVVVKDILGHSDIKLTQRYAHLAPGQTTEAMKVLGSALTGITAASPTTPVIPSAAPAEPRDLSSTTPAKARRKA